MSDQHRPDSVKGHTQQHGLTKEHGGPDQWEHLAHYAHQVHLWAEGVEFAADKLEHAAEYVKHAQAAAKLAKTHAQMAYDLRRMGRAITKLEHMARDGGVRGAKAMQQLPKTREALRVAQAEFFAEQRAVAKANTLLREFKTVQAGAKGQALVKLGQAAEELQSALSASRVGSKLLTVGRITTSKPFVRGLIVVGAAFEGAASYADSTARTTGGRVANAALGAGSGALTMVNPYVAVADFAAPTGYKLSEIYHGGAGAVTAIGEGVLTGDTRPMDDFHRRSMQGHYGKVMQAASEAGEFWANKGIGGGLREFADSVKWWVSH